MVALDCVSFQIEGGEQSAVVGKSGSGKSTLLNLLAGLDRATGGSLLVDGASLAEMTRSELAQYRREKIGIVFQAFQLMPTLSALDNVALPLRMSGVGRNDRNQRAGDWLERVGLGRRMDHRPYALSGGEQQRVALARALVHSPALLLADEPTGNLDESSAQVVEELLSELCRENDTTCILVTHDLALASRFADRCLMMSDGKLRQGDE